MILRHRSSLSERQANSFAWKNTGNNRLKIFITTTNRIEACMRKQVAAAAAAAAVGFERALKFNELNKSRSVTLEK
jgi:hypothetical protein